MKKNFIPKLFAIAATAGILSACSQSSSDKFSDSKKIEAPVENQYADQYPDVPDAVKFVDVGPGGKPVIEELKARYKDYLLKLKKDVEATGAKFVIVLLSADQGQNSSEFVKIAVPYIRSTAKSMGVDFIDFSTELQKYTVQQITQQPLDGHWSKNGASIIADIFAKNLKRYESAKSNATYQESERSATFGDLQPNDDEILDGGKNLPYHLIANSQGFRSNADLTFPKTKQRILFLGDSEIYCPFLDNEFTISNILQQKFPDKEFINTGMIGYTVDDYLSMFNDKAKYTEPDVVFVCTNPEDISDLYFSNRNRFSRTHRVVEPTEVEKTFYNKFLGKK